MEHTTQDSSSVDLSYYASVLRRRWRLVLLGLVVGVLASVALLAVKPQSATSWALVNVNPIADIAFSSSRPASDLLVAETEQAMARSTTVVDGVAAKSPPGVTASSVRDSMVATLLPESTILRIDYTAGSAEAAASGAVLVAQEYLKYRSAVARDRIDQAVEQLEERRTSLDRELQTVNREGAGEARRQSISDDLTSVNAQLNQLRAISTIGGTIISHPDPERAIVTPNRVLILLGGVLGGLLLGLVLPFLGNAVDRRVRDAQDVARAGGGTVVAMLEDAAPAVPAAARDSDQLRAVRERLLAVAPSGRPVVAVVDIGADGDLPSDVAVNLAVTFADLGKDTRLILADCPATSFERVARDLGLVEGRHAQHSHHFHSRLVPSLEVVAPAPAHGRLAAADVLAALLLEGRRSAVTVVGVGPSDGHAVRLTAARLADQVVLGVSRTATSIGTLTEVSAELRAVGASVLGTVLVRPDRVLDDRGGAPDDVEVLLPDPEADPQEKGDGSLRRGRSTWFSRQEDRAAGATSAEGEAEGEPEVEEPSTEDGGEVEVGAEQAPQASEEAAQGSAADAVMTAPSSDDGPEGKSTPTASDEERGLQQLG